MISSDRCPAFPALGTAEQTRPLVSRCGQSRATLGNVASASASGGTCAPLGAPSDAASDVEITDTNSRRGFGMSESSTAPLGGAPREAEPELSPPLSADERVLRAEAWRCRDYANHCDLHGNPNGAQFRAFAEAVERTLAALTAATARVGELCDALEIIEGDCLRKSDDPATTLFHIYTTARAARDQEEPRDRHA